MERKVNRVQKVSYSDIKKNGLINWILNHLGEPGRSIPGQSGVDGYPGQQGLPGTKGKNSITLIIFIVIFCLIQVNVVHKVLVVCPVIHLVLVVFQALKDVSFLFIVGISTIEIIKCFSLQLLVHLVFLVRPVFQVFPVPKVPKVIEVR